MKKIECLFHLLISTLFLIVAKQSLLIVAEQSSEKPFTSNPEKDIICSGDVCMDISKEKPLMGFERIEYVPTDSTMPIATNVRKMETFS